MKTPINVGLIGCGFISEIYLENSSLFPAINIVGCADVVPQAAAKKADRHQVQLMEVAELLADKRIDIVLNLTTPQHHVPVAIQALEAGKHVYSEKPLALSLGEADRLVTLAAEKNLRVGSAPDTFLGAAQQTARAAIDAGRIGTVLAGSAFMMVAGHESWHPNPDFYYQAGGGPLLDMGPYYLTALVNMLGPVAGVTGMAKAGYASRTIGSGARKGARIAVEVPTHILGALEFESGALVSLTTSFDVKSHGHSHIELYGTRASMQVSDPNMFGGDIRVSGEPGKWSVLEQVHLYADGNYRIVGLADMAQAIISGRAHRCGLELALHVLEIMEAIATSAREEKHIRLKRKCQRPAQMNAGLAFGHLD